jgi:hypothetical protein
MAAKDVVHEKQSSSWWGGTETMWCGVTADKGDLSTAYPVDCSGCLTALKKAGKKTKSGWWS